MRPLTCPNGQEHVFGFEDENPERKYVCLNCGTRYSDYSQEQAKIKRLIHIIGELSSSNNGGNPDILATAFYNAMNVEHRTLQQSFISSIAMFIKMMSEMPTDLRNEAAVEWCKKVSEIEAVFPRI